MADEGDARPALPPGWVWATLEDITLPQRPKLRPDPDSDLPFLGMDSIEPGSLKPSKVTRFGDMKSAATCFEPGDVLYGRLRPYLNKVWRADCSGAASAEFIVFPANPWMESDFLKLVLHHSRFVHFASHLVSGDRPRVDRNQIAGYELAVPPLAEQRRIVARIDELFGEIEAGEQELEKACEGLADFRRAVLKAAATGDLTRDWREKNAPNETGADFLARILAERRAAWEKAELAKMKAKGQRPKSDAWKARYHEPREPDTSDLPDLPQGWVWASGEQLFRWSSGENLSAQRMKAGPYPVYGGNGVNGRHSHWICERPTIVIGRVGAQCGNVHTTPGPAWITDNAIYAHWIADDIPLLYLRLMLEAADLNQKAAGSGQPFVNQKILNETPIAIAPLSEQLAIVDALEAHISENRQLDDVLSSGFSEATKLRQSILSWAFSGRLVPQDPNDEPATILLDRLRAASPAVPVRRKARQTSDALDRSPGRPRKSSVQETIL